MSDFSIPDMIEPIVAWRSWSVFAGGLCSINSGERWPNKQRMSATCSGSEPTTHYIDGWEAMPWRGEAVWVRDALDDEQLRHPSYHPPGYYGPGYSTAVMASGPVMHLEPLPDRPSKLLLPSGWKWKIGTRAEVFPPSHKESPDERCSCGIYALKSRNAAKKQGGDVYGEVYLWGKVIEAENGYRAQYAYPKELYSKEKLPNSSREALLEYGVPFDKKTAPSPPVSRPWWRFW